MTAAVPDILARIVDQKLAELEAERHELPRLERMAADRTGDCRPFAQALTAHPPAIITEIKRASPSKGLLADSIDPATIAAEYERGGAAALSVLTDREFFRGSLADLQSARAATALPVLRKDFTLDEFHVIEAAANGADAILLIAAILDVPRMRTLRELAESLGLAVLVEAHNGQELDHALESGARIAGINNRDLHTFRVDIATSLRLADRIPAGVVRVAESGIFTAADVQRLTAAGYTAFLVGEALMTSTDRAAAVRELRR